MVTKLNISSGLEEKIFDFKTNSDGKIIKIVSYFPLSAKDRQVVLTAIGSNSFDNFSSIFADTITDDEWNCTKEQIKKKLHDELFDIDN